MDKVVKLKGIAKRIASEAGVNISSDKQILKNRNSARTAKGWDTRRGKDIVKKADIDTVGEVKIAVRSMANNLDNPKKAAYRYATRKLIGKIRKLIVGKGGVNAT